ncbi:MAG: class I SAM-dependent methyltransferase [Pontibacterium sp.]
MNLYRRWIFPRLLSWASGKMDAERIHLMEQARGQVLELGSGTGANFRFYDTELNQLWALEPETPVMALAEQARQALPKADKEKIQLICGDGHHLPFPDHTMDTVICCLVLCTVPEPERMLAEVHRVLKPQGQLLVFEHVEADKHSPRLLRWQHRLNPIWRQFSCGCELIRPTRQTIEQAGFRFEALNEHRHPAFPALVSPIILGSARPVDAACFKAGNV